ncbi:MAG: glycosyltransferase family 2 protein, partial [Lachnospiraceae bacterium]|nr:glycosyltransferase family 2 protein [Lachnospiraceae bacterium]
VYLPWKNMPLLQLLLNLPLLLLGYLVKTLFFVKKGLGGEYVRGLLEGVRLCLKKESRERRVRFQWKHLINYGKIQVQLWVNIFRIL